MALRCRSDGKCRERESKSPGAGLFRAKQSGEIAARRRKVGCSLKGLTRFCTTSRENRKSKIGKEKKTMLAALRVARRIKRSSVGPSESSRFSTNVLAADHVERFKALLGDSNAVTGAEDPGLLESHSRDWVGRWNPASGQATPLLLRPRSEDEVKCSNDHQQP